MERRRTRCRIVTSIRASIARWRPTRAWSRQELKWWSTSGGKQFLPSTKSTRSSLWWVYWVPFVHSVLGPANLLEGPWKFKYGLHTVYSTLLSMHLEKCMDTMIYIRKSWGRASDPAASVRSHRVGTQRMSLAMRPISVSCVSFKKFRSWISPAFLILGISL
jgi:hypothetical protein